MQTHRSMVPPSTCCKMMTIACRLSQLFFLSSSNTAKIRSHIGEEKVEVLSARRWEVLELVVRGWVVNSDDGL